jgi:SLA1 homology domain 1, SHD1
MFRSRFFPKATSLCLVAAFLSAQAAAQPAKLKWTDNTEKTTIDAEFVRMADGAVVIKKDGKEISVPLTKLSLASHLQALKLAKPEAYAKAPPKAVIGIEQTAESTRLLNESPFKDNQTIEEFLDTLTTELEAGNATAMWHALTPEMQADVEDVVVAAVETGGKGMLVQIRTLMKHAATIVKEKKTFVFASPLVPTDQKVAREMQQTWPQIELFTEALTDKTNWDSANFKAGSVGPWIAALTSKIGSASVKMNQLAVKAGLPGSDFKKAMAYKVVSQSGDTAMVQFLDAGPPRMNPQTRQMMQPKPPEPVEWVRVSGKWLPKNVVDSWKDGVAEAKGQLDFAMPSVSSSLALVIPFASSLANAKSQQEFNAALQPIMGIIQSSGVRGGSGMGGMQGGMQDGTQGGIFGGMMPSSGSSAPGGRPGRPSADQ